jgi:hypothetical protein
MNRKKIPGIDTITYNQPKKRRSRYLTSRFSIKKLAKYAEVIQNSHFTCHKGIMLLANTYYTTRTIKIRNQVKTMKIKQKTKKCELSLRH